MLEVVLQWFFLNLNTHVLNQNPFLSFFSRIALKWVIWILYLKIEIITVIHYNYKFVLVCSERKVSVGSHCAYENVTDNSDLLADFKVGDVIQSIRVTNGLENVVNPAYKAGAA